MNHDPQTDSLVTRDGVRLTSYLWEARSAAGATPTAAAHPEATAAPTSGAGPGAARAHLVVVHGYMEHGARYAELAEALALQGVSTRAFDLRGHGRSPGPRGYIEAFDDYLEDLDSILKAAPPDVPRFVLGHSLGGLIALLYTLRRRPALHGLILSNPYLARALPVPAWKLAAGRLLGSLAPRISLDAGLDRQLLTHDPAVLARHASDPLIFHKATAGWFREIELQHAQLAAAASPIELGCPALVCVGSGDQVACPRASQQLAGRLQAPRVDLVLLEGQYHEVLQEVERAALFARIGAWMSERAAEAAPAPC